MKKILLSLPLLMALVIDSGALGSTSPTKEEVKSYLNNLHLAPAQYMWTLPEKANHSGNTKFVHPSSREDLITRKNYFRNYVTDKSNSPLKLFGDWSDIDYQNNPSTLMPGPYRVESNIKNLEQQDLKEGSVLVQPWSDDYWATAYGGIGYRYGDDKMVQNDNWKDHYDYVQINTAEKISLSGDKSAIDLLSPSEKYDLVMGNLEFPLTQKAWDEGRYYFEKVGEVETWFGICHGWAAASYMLERPTKSVEIPTEHTEHPVTFRPSDIKALASQLWAKGESKVNYVGSRCNGKDVETDDNGRIIDSICFDTNPATWHLAVLNLVGMHKKSFIIDASFDYEVWNQPLLDYSFTYFNPKNREKIEDLSDAMIPIEEYDDDLFVNYRSEKTRSIVGVAMNVSYMMETIPSLQHTDAPSNDAANTVTYYYDLELDEHQNIIGGEWYTNLHPDFLWTPIDNADAQSAGDRLARGPWDGKKSAPPSWQKAAEYSSRWGAPLSKFVNLLIKLSNQGEQYGEQYE